MTKFKKGDRAIINVPGESMDLRFNGRTAFVLEGFTSPLCAIDGGDVMCSFNEDHLTPIEPSIDTLCVGDVVFTPGRNEREVIAVSGKAFLLADSYSAYNWYIKEELKNKRYTFKSPEPEKQTAYDKNGNVLGEIKDGKIIK